MARVERRKIADIDRGLFLVRYTFPGLANEPCPGLSLTLRTWPASLSSSC
jgi:hypothetical protein